MTCINGFLCNKCVLSYSFCDCNILPFWMWEKFNKIIPLLNAVIYVYTTEYHIRQNLNMPVITINVPSPSALPVFYTLYNM